MSSESEGTDEHQDGNTSVNVQDLPPELLVLVFRFLPHATVAEKLRLVSRRIRAAAELMLNTALPRILRQLDRAARRLRAVATAPVQEDEPGHNADDNVLTRRKQRLRLCRGYTALCDTRAQMQLLHAVTWRYTQPVFTGEDTRACFYGGRVLDLAESVLHLALVAPASLAAAYYRCDPAAPPLPHPLEHLPPCDRWRLQDAAKHFMNHFEKVTECSLNSNPSDWGAKVVDMLQCLVDGPRSVTSSNSGFSASGQYRKQRAVPVAPSVEASAVGAKGHEHKSRIRLSATFRLRRSWFVAVETGQGDGAGREGGDYSWRDDIKYMHMRVRRLVSSHNVHVLHPRRHQRILMGEAGLLGANQHRDPLSISASAYSGFGEYGGRFFYYGNMNARAVRQKLLSWVAEQPIPPMPIPLLVVVPVEPWLLDDGPAGLENNQQGVGNALNFGGEVGMDVAMAPAGDEPDEVPMQVGGDGGEVGNADDVDGGLNPQAIQLIHPAAFWAEHNDDLGEEGESDEDDEDEANGAASDPDAFLNLYIKVELRCPLRLAPYSVLRQLTWSELERADAVEAEALEAEALEAEALEAEAQAAASASGEAGTPRLRPRVPRPRPPLYSLSLEMFSPENAMHRLPTYFRWEMPQLDTLGGVVPRKPRAEEAGKKGTTAAEASRAPAPAPGDATAPAPGDATAGPSTLPVPSTLPDLLSLFDPSTQPGPSTLPGPSCSSPPPSTARR